MEGFAEQFICGLVKVARLPSAVRRGEVGPGKEYLGSYATILKRRWQAGRDSPTESAEGKKLKETMRGKYVPGMGFIKQKPVDRFKAISSPYYGPTERESRQASMAWKVRELKKRIAGSAAPVKSVDPTSIVDKSPELVGVE